jgi:non-heme chloroperoxidase
VVLSGEKDHTVPHASFTQQRHNPGITEFTEIKERGHSLTIDHGWSEVADIALRFVRRFA